MKNKLITPLTILLLFASILPLSVHANSIIGPIRGLWYFDEGTGTTAYDSSGHVNHGTVYGGAVWTDGKVGKALEFDGVNDYVGVPDSNSLDIAGKITLEAWIYPHTVTKMQVIVQKYNYSGPPYDGAYYLGVGGYGYNNKILFGLSYNGYNFYYILSNTNITANTWTHVAATSNGTHMIIYINGIKDKVATYPPGVIYASTAPLRIGCFLPELGVSRFFDGVIDEVRVSAGAIWTVDDDRVQCPNADFTNIQAAINAANSGDTIIVHEGTYVENVNMNKSVALKSASHPTIDGNQAGPCVTMAANGVLVDGFELINGTYGVASWGTDNSFVSNNVIHDILNVPGYAGCGIMFWSDSDDFDNNTIRFNEIYDNDRQGIYIGGESPSYISERNVIRGNIIYNNGLNRTGQGPDASAYGIQLSFADDNVIDGNEIYWHDDWFPYSGFDFAQGIYLYDSNNNAITNNNLHDNNYGVGIWRPSRAAGTNYINYNNIAGNTGYGVRTFDGLPAVDARFNWWGNSSGPTHSSNPSGTGGTISNNVDYSPWLGFVVGTSPMNWHVNPTGAPGAIQEAINEASPGDTILVHDGTYREALLINKSLTIKAASKPIIEAPDTRNTYTISESAATFDPIVFAYGGTMSGGAVSGSGTIDVTFDGFEIDGRNKAASARYVGILYRNVNPGVIANNTLHNMYDADGQGNGPQTFGILTYGDSDVTIEYNEVRDFSRGGIGVVGDNGALPDPVATVAHNTVAGNGLEAGSGWWAENGIQMGYGAGGIIRDNEVADCKVNNPNWVSTGILVYLATPNVHILHNLVADCDTGIAVSSTVLPTLGLVDGNNVTRCTWDAIRIGLDGPADQCNVTNNVISNSWAGIGVWDASTNLIENNTVESNDYGIYISGDCHNNTVVQNLILNNNVDGILVELYGVDPSGTEVHYNNITGNGVYGVEKTGTAIVNATCNWWGDASGPYHATSWMYMGSPYGPHYGLGDNVSDYVLYDPWLPLEQHDISIISVTTSKPHVPPGRIVNITVVVKNNGEASETFNVTAYRDSIPIGTILVTDLGVGENTTLIFQWNTSGLTPCYNWTIEVEAPLVGDNNQTDNTFTDGTVKIAMLGDINGDGVISITDVVITALAFGSRPGDPNWNPDADLRPDNIIDIIDFVIIGVNFGKTCP